MLIYLDSQGARRPETSINVQGRRAWDPRKRKECFCVHSELDRKDMLYHTSDDDPPRLGRYWDSFAVEIKLER